MSVPYLPNPASYSLGLSTPYGIIFVELLALIRMKQHPAYIIILGPFLLIRAVVHARLMIPISGQAVIQWEFAARTAEVL